MVEWLVERLISTIPALSDLRNTKRELADSAIASLSLAVTETSIYFSQLGEGGEPDREREYELGRLWAAAAVPLRRIDRELADQCEYKADSWIHPGEWPPERVSEYGIKLDDVREQFGELKGRL